MVFSLSFILDLTGLDRGAGRGSRTPKTRRSADFESAASASSAIPAWDFIISRAFNSASFEQQPHRQELPQKFMVPATATQPPKLETRRRAGPGRWGRIALVVTVV